MPGQLGAGESETHEVVTARAKRHAGGMAQNRRREREQVLSEYGTWRITADEGAPAVAEVQTLETLLRLKADQLDSPEPGLWTEQLATTLLTEVVPRTVIQPRERVMDLVPTLRHFFIYLRETGRWHEESMSASEAPTMLSGLEFAALEAADDPSRRSFSTNILGYGLSLGVDLEDDDELAAFMHWYDGLPDAERVALGDTGRLPAPSRPYDREAALLAVSAEGRSGDRRPWFLPAPEEPVDLDERSYLDSAFVAVAAAILEHIGMSPRKVTSTGALGRADATAVLEALGRGQTVRTMWHHPELVGPWYALLDGGWLEIEGGRVRRTRGPVRYLPHPDALDGSGSTAETEEFIDFAHALLTAALLGKDARDGEDGGFLGMPDTLNALLSACTPEGLLLPDRSEAPLDPATGTWDLKEVERLFAVRHDLEGLADIGLLERDGSRFTGSAAVMVAAVALLRAQDGPEG